MQFHRKNIRLHPENYLGGRSYFVTICCDHRRKVFSSNRLAHWLVDRLLETAAKSCFRVHAYCVMPDHLHFLAEGTEATSDLLEFVGRLKHRTGIEWQKRTASRLWQHKFYDHILRAWDNADSVAWYIWMNAVRAGLCQKPQDYPFSGSLTINWRGTKEPAAAWIPPWKQKTM